MDIRNVAIIAHVDHGKTTLVDAMLKQSHIFRQNQKEMNENLIMDSNVLEKEKGITILAKNTSIFYKGVKINIIDTPGHSDFGGEVERTINMADGAILLVDSAEGPLPQTKFVLKKALEANLKIILIINKIDKRDARPLEILNQVENLFLELANKEDQLHFSTLYAVGKDGKIFYHLPKKYSSDLNNDVLPLFETIIKEIPNSSKDVNRPFQMLISNLDWDNYVGRICIGRVNQGILKKNETICLVDENKILGNFKAQKLYTFEGLEKKEVDEIISGDIVGIAGISEINIGQTITHQSYPFSLPKIKIDEPTIKITIGSNTSPFAGKEGKFVTSRQIKERLLKEKQINLGLKIEENFEENNFVVSGRGELHLSILIETMRREGFELQISKPQVIYKNINGVEFEPYEEVTIDCDKEFMGEITEEFGKRKGELLDMITKENNIRLKYKISDNNLLGIRSILMTKTRGTAIMSTYFLGYFPKGKKIESLRNGALVAVKSGEAVTYGLINAQERGTLFVSPGEKIYEGMVVGIGTREFDIEVNVCKEKKLTNNRSAGEGVSIPLIPAVKMTLEQCLDFIAEDEYLEVTPLNLRIRKKILSLVKRRVAKRIENKNN
ncbi:MAG: translational GTPase TypA [Patescibacteria group bacterium]|nr:translational GTPase TypA [Patescibacteria group bacterium]